MNKTKKLLLSILAVALVAAIAIGGTMAYLTDRERVVNSFTVGNVDITLDEEKVNPDGTPTPADDERVQSNEYHLIPGCTYVKDPTVTVKAGSEESYVRMLVTINCYDALQTIYEGAFLPQNFVAGWDSAVWVSTREVSVAADGKSATYEFRYFETVKPEATADTVLDALFDSFTIPGSFDGDDLAALADLEITVVAHAIQTVGFEADAAAGISAEDAAWAAFDAANI